MEYCFWPGAAPIQKRPPAFLLTPKWKGPAYRLAFDTNPAKPNPAGIALPGIKFTANPEALERRVTLVVRYDSSEVKSDNLIINQVILAPFDISGATAHSPPTPWTRPTRAWRSCSGATA